MLISVDENELRARIRAVLDQVKSGDTVDVCISVGSLSAFLFENSVSEESEMGG